MNHYPTLEKLRRKNCRHLGWREKRFVWQNFWLFGDLLLKPSLVFFAICSIGIALKYSPDPIANLLFGNAWVSLLLIQRLAVIWENRVAMLAEPEIALRSALPVADATLFRIRYWRMLLRISGFAIIVWSSWLWAAMYIEAPTWKWAVAAFAGTAQLLLVVGLGCWVARGRRLDSQRLWIVSALCMLALCLTIFSGSSIDRQSIGLALLPLPHAWPGIAVLCIAEGASWWWPTVWIGICFTWGGWLSVRGFRRLESDFVIHEFAFMHGYPCWMVTEYGYEQWRCSIEYNYEQWRSAVDNALLNQTEAALATIESAEPESVRPETRQWVSKSLTSESLQQSYWKHVGCFEPCVRWLLTDREQFLAAMVCRPERSWTQQWRFYASACIILAVVASIFVPAKFGTVALGFLAMASVYHVCEWQFLAEHLLKLPVSISEIVWMQTKLHWLRLIAWTPLILVTAMTGSHLLNEPVSTTLVITGKLYYTAVLALPAAQLTHLLCVGNQPWLRWSVLFGGITFMLCLVIAALGAVLMLVTEMPLSLTGAILQFAGAAGFVITGCLWFNHGCFDLPVIDGNNVLANCRVDE